MKALPDHGKHLSVDEAKRRANEGERASSAWTTSEYGDDAPAAYDWDPDDRDSRRWDVARTSGKVVEEAANALPPVKHTTSSRTITA